MRAEVLSQLLSHFFHSPVKEAGHSTHSGGHFVSANPTSLTLLSHGLVKEVWLRKSCFIIDIYIFSLFIYTSFTYHLAHHIYALARTCEGVVKEVSLHVHVVCVLLVLAAVVHRVTPRSDDLTAVCLLRSAVSGCERSQACRVSRTAVGPSGWRETRGTTEGTPPHKVSLSFTKKEEAHNN
jgi:hypothetical protein